MGASVVWLKDEIAPRSETKARRMVVFMVADGNTAGAAWMRRNLIIAAKGSHENPFIMIS
jgi:hypothetical protein